MKTNEAFAETLVEHIFTNSQPSRGDVLKVNVLRLAADHRDNCSQGCAISLCLLRELAERAGLTFSDEEKQLFY